HFPFEAGVAQGEAGKIAQVDGRLDHRRRRRRQAGRRQRACPPHHRPPFCAFCATPPIDPWAGLASPALPALTSGRSLSPPRAPPDRAAWPHKVALTTRKRGALQSRKILPSLRAGGPRRAKSWFCPIAPIARPHARGTCGGDRPGKRHGWLITV